MPWEPRSGAPTADSAAGSGQFHLPAALAAHDPGHPHDHQRETHQQQHAGKLPAARSAGAGRAWPAGTGAAAADGAG